MVAALGMCFSGPPKTPEAPPLAQLAPPTEVEEGMALKTDDARRQKMNIAQKRSVVGAPQAVKAVT